jgi:hypothetical protein
LLLNHGLLLHKDGLLLDVYGLLHVDYFLSNLLHLFLSGNDLDVFLDVGGVDNVAIILAQVTLEIVAS